MSRITEYSHVWIEPDGELSMKHIPGCNWYFGDCTCGADALNELIDKQATELDIKNKALLRIQTWAQAYPLDIFPPPNLIKAGEALKADGQTLDSVSADAMRHVLSQLTDIVATALKGDVAIKEKS